MAFDFDLNKLMQDPNFISGIGLLGAASPRGKPLLQAYQMLQQAEQGKREQAEREQMMEYRRAQTKAYERQVAAQEAALPEAEKNRTFMREVMQGMQGRQVPQMPAAPTTLPQSQLPMPPGVTGPTNAVETAMRSSVNQPMGPDPQALTREIVATQNDLSQVQDPSSRAQLTGYLADLKQQQADLNKRIVSGSPEKATQQRNLPTPTAAQQLAAAPESEILPEISIDEKGGMRLAAKPSYERARLQQQAQQNAEELAVKQAAEKRQEQERLTREQRESPAGRQATIIAEGGAKEYLDWQQRANKASSRKANMQRLASYLEGADTGSYAGLKLTLQKLASPIINVPPGASDMEAAQALSRRMAMEIRDPSEGAGSPGSITEWEAKQFQSMEAGIDKLPGANKLIMQAYIKNQDRQIAIAKIFRDYRKENKGVIDEGVYDKIEQYKAANPLFDPKEIAKLPSLMQQQPGLPPGVKIERVK